MSDYTIRAIISQLDSKEQLRSITFYLKKITSAELNYKIYNKELLTIVAVFEEWKIYLKKFIYSMKILIDHKNLLYFTIIKKLNKR